MLHVHPSAKIHPTAIVDDGARIGAKSILWHWVHICSGATIGERCSFGQNVYVGNDVRIGNNVKIQNNVSVYDSIVIEDDVFCGPSMVFTNVYNPRSHIVRKNEYRSTIVRKGVTFGANSTVVCGNEIKEYAFIGAGSLVNKTIQPYSLVVGIPAKQIGWMSAYGEKIDLPIFGEGEWVCPKTGDKYILFRDEIERIPSRQ